MKKTLLLLLCLLSFTAFAAEYNEVKLLAEQGDIDAQYELGLIYENGKGVISDPIQAYAWFSVASALGYEGASRNRDHLERRMTSAQITKAKALAQEYFARVTQQSS